MNKLSLNLRKTTLESFKNKKYWMAFRIKMSFLRVLLITAA